MKTIALVVGLITVAGIVAATTSTSQPADQEASPIYGVRTLRRTP